jgi:hypothetical protein
MAEIIEFPKWAQFHALRATNPQSFILFSPRAQGDGDCVLTFSDYQQPRPAREKKLCIKG